MTRLANSFVSLCLSVTIAGCARYISYSGDGRFVDNGPLMYSMRYVLDLGPIDLETHNTRTYRLSELPNAEFVVGLELVEPSPNSVRGPRPDHRGRVRVELRTSAGAVVISENQPLSEWVWSYALGGTTSRLYLRGESKDVPIPGGARPVRVGEKASGGWGTYFKARSRETYTLTIEVIEPLSVKGRPARVRVVGWDLS